MKYMVMTTKHHEGFCNFDTKLTNYCAPKQAAGRDLVAEYYEAARAKACMSAFITHSWIGIIRMAPGAPMMKPPAAASLITSMVRSATLLQLRKA